MVDERGRANGSAVITRGRLDEDLPERRLLADLAIRRAVQRDPSGQAERDLAAAAPRGAEAPVEVSQHMKERLFQTHLEGGGHILVVRGQLRIGEARRAEGVDVPRREDGADGGGAGFPAHLDAMAVVREVVQVQLELPRVRQAEDLPELVQAARLPVRGQPHHFPLVPVLAETQILGGGGVENSQAVGILDPVQHLQAIAVAAPDHRTHEVAKAIHRQQGRLLER